MFACTLMLLISVASTNAIIPPFTFPEEVFHEQELQDGQATKGPRVTIPDLVEVSYSCTCTALLTQLKLTACVTSFFYN